MSRASRFPSAALLPAVPHSAVASAVSEPPGRKGCRSAHGGPTCPGATRTWQRRWQAAVAVCLLAASAAAVGDDRFVAWLADGTAVTSPALPGWPLPAASWHLADRNLLAPERLVRLVRDRLARIQRRPPFVALANGDVLCGQPVRWERDPASGHGGRLWVQLEAPLVPLAGTALPVRADRVAAIVLDESATTEPPQSGHVRLADRRHWLAQAIRWEEEGLALLTSQGIQHVPFRDLAEVGFPGVDPLAALLDDNCWADTEQGGLLTRWQTTQGAALTTARVRREEQWPGPRRSTTSEVVYVLQPAWALAPLAVPPTALATCSLRRTDELPLTLLPARRLAHATLLAPLQPAPSSQPLPGWVTATRGEADLGLHVRAATVLAWDLPAGAEQLLVQVGLDHTVGAGGCVRCQVWGGPPTDPPSASGSHRSLAATTAGTPPPASTLSPMVAALARQYDCLWNSGVFQGKDGLKTPPPLSLAGRRQVLLVADFAHEDRPEGADPLDIRDRVVWLNPLVKLASSATSTTDLLASRLPGTAAWQIDGPKSGKVELKTQWHAAASQWDSVLKLPAGSTFTLRRQVTVAPTADVLELLTVCPLDLDEHQVALRIDGVEVPWVNNADRNQLRQWTLRYSRLRASGQEPEGNLTDRLAYWWDLQAWHGRPVMLELAIGGPHRVEMIWRSLALRSAVSNLPADGRTRRPDVPLTSLKPVDEPAGEFNRPIMGSIPINREGEPIRFLGKIFSDGYGMGRNSRISFAILPSFRSFVAVVGCCQQAVGPLKILVDDRVVWQRPVLSSLWPAEQIEIPLPPGAKRLTLQTGTSGLYYGFAAFANSGFMLESPPSQGGSDQTLPSARERSP